MEAANKEDNWGQSGLPKKSNMYDVQVTRIQSAGNGDEQFLAMVDLRSSQPRIRQKMLLKLFLCDRQLSYMQQDSDNRYCQACGYGAYLDSPHVMFECEVAIHVRTHWWPRVEQSCPPGLCLSLLSMITREKATCILSGLNSISYCHEWRDMYANMCLYTSETNKKVIIIMICDNRIFLKYT